MASQANKKTVSYQYIKSTSSKHLIDKKTDYKKYYISLMVTINGELKTAIGSSEGKSFKKAAKKFIKNFRVSMKEANIEISPGIIVRRISDPDEFLRKYVEKDSECYTVPLIKKN
jgi:hypothetical protein